MVLIVLTYVAGVLTILSPCILPVLPFVFSKAQGPFSKSGLPLLAGMSLTFSIFSGIAIIGGEWISHANEIGRIVAMVLMSLFGLSLIFPHLSDKAMMPLTRLGSKIGGRSENSSFRGSFVIGMSTGLLWAPCAGPILGLVLTGAASRGNIGASVGLLLSYSLGAATSLALALVAGNKFLGTLKKFLGVDQVIKKGLGVAVILGVLAIAFNLDRTVLTRISKFETSSVENKLMAYVGLDKKEGAKNETATLQDEGALPDLTGADSWINSKPLTSADLRGKVVLIDFWTYSCINCLRTLPYLKAWYEKYKGDGLVIIGVHTPEFAFEKSLANVQKAVTDLGITYPVAVDSSYKIWNAFQNRYWPAHYFIDRKGRIRHHHFGEGEYSESEDIIRQLLSENGSQIQGEKTNVRGEGVQAISSSDNVKSPETYVGYTRAKNFSDSSGEKEDRVFDYKAPTSLQLNQWALKGRWLVEAESAVSKSAASTVSFRFQARDLHLVLGAGNKVIKFKVTIDGQTPGKNHGVDTDEEGRGQIDSHRLYQLIRQSGDGPVSEHTFEIEFSSPDAEVYAFTFG
jgi:cytochrome c biogenesis protein CcdA/thiol-disulfide isomerase/thioredoxin